MALMVCCGVGGLLEERERWQQLSCPLPVPQLIAVQGSLRAVVDNTQRLMWLGDHLFPVDGGVEQLLLWHGHPLVLSGETNCLTLLEPSTGEPLFLAPTGVYPQDMCLLPNDRVAVCGGGSGCIHLLQLPELRGERRLPVPGLAQRVAWHSGWLYILCSTGEDGLCCLLCRVRPRGDRYEPLFTWSGLPGALHAGRHGLWVSVSERLCRFRLGNSLPDHSWGEFGLIRYITEHEGALLLSDTLQGALYQLDAPCRSPRLLLEGDVGQAAFV